MNKQELEAERKRLEGYISTHRQHITNLNDDISSAMQTKLQVEEVISKRQDELIDVLRRQLPMYSD